MIEKVVLDNAATDEEVRAVAAVLRNRGFDVEPQPSYGRRSAEALPWIIQVVLAAPFAAFFVSFSSSFGREAGKGAYAAFEGWLKDLRQARRTSAAGRGSIDVVDPDGTHVILSSELRERAIAALANIDWSQERGAYLVWDDEHGWRDPIRRLPGGE